MATLVVALDLPGAAEARAMAKNLAGAVSWLKIGLELFISAGPDLARELKDSGFKIFLDLKFYDIPNTVAAAAVAAARLHVDMLTLHLQGGERMCRQALEAVRAFEARPLLFGVTALTSFAAGEMPGIRESPSEFGLFLACRAAAWGLDGVVCSGHETAAIKKACPTLACLCPGIRPGGADMGDQRRVMTPARAAALGADYLVVGRPVTRAADPRAAALAIIREAGGNAAS